MSFLDSVTEGNVVCRFLTHDVLYKNSNWKGKHFAEVLKTDLVIFDVPIIADLGMEHRLLTTVLDLLRHNLFIVIIVQPALRSRSPVRIPWMNRWNDMNSVPFKFYQTCSCKVNTSVLNMHFTVYIANSFGIDMPSCRHLPTLGGERYGCTTYSGQIFHLPNQSKEHQSLPR